MDFSFDAYLKTAPPMIILKADLSGFSILNANDAFLKATHTHQEELVGKGYFDAFPENPSLLNKNTKSLKDSLIAAVKSGEKQTLYNQRFDIPVWGTGRFNTRHWRMDISPVGGNQHEVKFIVMTTIDMTIETANLLKERFIAEVSEEKRQVTEQIEEQLRLAIDSAEMGTWHFEVGTRTFKTSARMKALYGFEHIGEMTYRNAIAQIMPEYRKSVKKSIKKALADNAPFSIEFQIKSYNSEKIRWLRATGKRYLAEASHIGHFSGTVIDITERKQEELRKNDFLSIASHELKTPLTSLKASLQLLNKMKHTPQEPMLSKLIDQSNKSMDKINSLVNKLLNVRTITDGNIELNNSVFTLSEMLDGCCDHVVSAGTHELVADGNLDLKVYADLQRIDQVVVNLVNNAVKYAPGSFKIIIRIEDAFPMAKISVQDFGPGIPQNQLENIFKRYYRAVSKNTQSNGLGLGLYISSEIINKHGGEMGVFSELDKGSTFWFTIPLSR